MLMEEKYNTLQVSLSLSLSIQVFRSLRPHTLAA
jgi:hypothetical protein